jgi:hypothetical protein
MIDESNVDEHCKKYDLKRFVVAAACRVIGDEDVMVVSARHFDTLMHRIVDHIGLRGKGVDWEQGFIDQWGVFMTREVALTVATEGGQKLDLTVGGSHHQLFSECLY